MQFSSRNSKLTLNNDQIVANSASFSLDASLNPLYRENRKSSVEFSPFDGVRGSLNVSYSLTGSDPLRESVFQETGLISGNFGGLYFPSGYLQSYGLDFKPNSPITVNANIVFFDGLSGHFSPVFEKSTPHKTLEVGDISITGCSIGNLDEIQSLSYNFNASVEPQYIIGETRPRKVTFRDRSITLNLESSNITGFLPAHGVNGSVGVTLLHPDLSSFSDILEVDGRIVSRSIDASTSSVVSNSLTIRQDRSNRIPMISGIHYVPPLRGGQILTISGKYFSNVESVLFCINGEHTPRAPALRVIRRSDIKLLVTTPSNISNGLIEVI
jgi:hypothetical protein